MIGQIKLPTAAEQVAWQFERYAHAKGYSIDTPIPFEEVQRMVIDVNAALLAQIDAMQKLMLDYANTLAWHPQL